MANVFYDRSGKAHVIGSKGDKSKDKEKDKDEHKSSPSKSTKAKTHGDHKSRDHSEKSSRGGNRFERSSGRDTPRGGGRADKGGFRPFEKREGSGSARKPIEVQKHAARGRDGGRGGRDAPRGGGRDGGRGGRGGGKSEFRGGARGEHRGSRRKIDTRPSLAVNPDWMKVKGVVDKNKRGSAFLVFDRADLEDVFIPRYYMEQLFHGDRVEVYVDDTGEIQDLKVLEHRFKEIFGRVMMGDGHTFGPEFKKSKQKAKTGYLVYERKKAKEEVYVPSIPADVKDGDWVRAELVFGENGVVTAKITERIGETLPAIYDIPMVAGEFNLVEHHTFDAVKQAESYKLEIPGKDEAGRTDLRHLPFMTIDGERARDFDDAVYVERRQNGGFKLWVAIADVSHYVKVGTPLDHEAYIRATSVYFPERAFHMLPRALSEELCSLKPKVPRLSMATSIEYSKTGEKGEIKLYNAIIESRRRATYTEIEAEKKNPEHADMFELYELLKKARFTRGSIDFDFPEAEIILDEKTGEPEDIVVRPRNDAHRLIEEFMIRANESVTEWMIQRKLPFIYRIHDEPSMEAIEKFRRLSKNMGVPLLASNGIPRPKVMAEFIRLLKDHPAEPVLATALLRSMRQAIYSATYGEHYGLASEAYTHFTSPIRRYPDLIVHRLLREALLREEEGRAQKSGTERDEEQNKLEEMAEHCSYRERIASEAERESIRFKQIRLMAKNIGKEFEGKINGLTEKGMFVLLDHPYCEGMISVDSLKDDFYQFNEDRMMTVGRKSKKTFSIGQRVKIQVVRVDLDARRIEFELR